MNTYHLKYLYDTYRLQSVVLAAAENNVVPSTVSQALKTLEVELGFPLTLKSRGQLSLTPKAAEVALKIPALLAQIQNLKQLSSVKVNQLQGNLRIATHQSLLASHLWKPVRAFKKIHPKVEISLFTGVSSHLSHLLSQNQVDMVISLNAPARTSGLKSEPLYRGKFIVAGRPSVAFSKTSPVVVTSRSQPEVQYLLRNNPWIKIDEEITNWSTVLNIISKEPVFGYLPDYLVTEKLVKVLQVKKQNFDFRIQSSFLKTNPFMPAIHQFNELAKGCF